MKQKAYVVAQTCYSMKNKRSIVAIDVTMAGNNREKDISLEFEQEQDLKDVEKAFRKFADKIKKFRKEK